VKNFVDGLSNEQVDVLTFESVRFLLIKKFQARIDTWDKVLIIPERLVPALQETTLGRVTKLPRLQQLLILRYCKNSLETFNMTFPFVSEEDDL